MPRVNKQRRRGLKWFDMSGREDVTHHRVAVVRQKLVAQLRPFDPTQTIGDVFGFVGPLIARRQLRLSRAEARTSVEFVPFCQLFVQLIVLLF